MSDPILYAIGAFVTLVPTLISVMNALDLRRMKAAEARKVAADARKTESEAALNEATADEKSSTVAISTLKELREQIAIQGGQIEKLQKEVDNYREEKTQLRSELSNKEREILMMKSSFESKVIFLQSQIDRLREQVIALGGTPVVSKPEAA